MKRSLEIRRQRERAIVVVALEWFDLRSGPKKGTPFQYILKLAELAKVCRKYRRTYKGGARE